MSGTLKSEEQNRQAQVIAAETQQHVSFGKKLLYYLWDSDQHLKSPAERKLIRKLDLGILICATLGWWMKYVDQSNLANAYVSGMKEDLNITGNEYTYMGICYTISFAIMQIPANLIVLKVRPSIWLCFCEVGWAIFTFAQAGAQNSQQMYAFRFMVGLFESSFSPVIIFLLGSWYSKAELAKRVAIWHLTGFFGSATSGFLQAGIYNNLNGRLGLAGWRWLYIVCGCMTMPVAISVFFLLPDYPTNCRVWYITEDEKLMAQERSANAGKAATTGLLDMALFKRIFKSWRWYVLVLMYIFYGNACQANSYFAIWLKSAGYSVDQRNVIPACANLVSMATTFIWGFGSDLTRNRFWWMIGPLVVMNWPGNLILTIWPASTQAIIAGFFLVSGEYVTCVVWTWANEICRGSAEERAITIASMNGIFYATNSFLPILIYPQTMAPDFRYGFPTTLAFGVMAVVMIVITEIFHRRQLRQEAAVQASLPVTERVSEEDEAEKELDNKVDGTAIGINQVTVL